MKTSQPKPAERPRSGPDNEAADPVGDGHSDAELAARTSAERPRNPPRQAPDDEAPPGQARQPVEPDRRTDLPDDGKGGGQQPDELGPPRT